MNLTISEIEACALEHALAAHSSTGPPAAISNTHRRRVEMILARLRAEMELVAEPQEA